MQPPPLRLHRCQREAVDARPVTRYHSALKQDARNPSGSSRMKLVPLICCCSLLAFAGARHAAAQTRVPVAVENEIFAGSELERYLRALQITGTGAALPWSVRPFGPREVARMFEAGDDHPWAGRFEGSPGSGGRRVALLPAEMTGIFNSGFPFGGNDGAVWAGKGISAAGAAGAAGKWGPLSVTIYPTVFITENACFELLDNRREGAGSFADGQVPGAIDRPQRFGDGRYLRADPGQSTIRLDAGGIAAGVTTANQVWGPAVDYPLIIGINAPGIPRIFVGSSQPVNVGIGRLHAQLIWGSLAESAYSTAHPDSSRRFAAGAAGVFLPRFAEGLELGAARFFHRSWPTGGPGAEELLLPLQGIFKAGRPETGSDPFDPRSDATNQLASIFARWAFPRAGLEVFAEYAREDHSWDGRDLTLEPDHSAGYLAGVQKGWRPTSGHLWVLRGEVLNAQPSHLARVRLQVPFYTHFAARQGHTLQGQIIGSPAAFGGAGAVLSVDHYHRRGRFGLAWNRVLRQETIQTVLDPLAAPAGLDVIHSLSASGLWFAGQFEMFGSLATAYEFNRDFAGDAFNLNAQAGLRARF